MKKYSYLLAALALAPALTFTSCSDEEIDIQTVVEPNYTTMTFEGSNWDALIDPVEYGGAMLYGTSGLGYADDETVYNWTDSTTWLHSHINEGNWGTAFFSGGAAVSNYHCDIADGGYLHQLSIPTGLAAHSGNNFLVVTGYDNEPYGDTRATFSFADGKSHTLNGLWVTATSYFIHELQVGEYTAAATADTYVDLVFYGYNAAGEQTDTVKTRLQDGTTPLTAWRHVSLTKLGAVTTVKVGFEGSEDQYGQYGLNTPAYVAVDDIEVRK